MLHSLALYNTLPYIWMFVLLYIRPIYIGKVCHEKVEMTDWQKIG